MVRLLVDICDAPAPEAGLPGPENSLAWIIAHNWDRVRRQWDYYLGIEGVGTEEYSMLKSQESMVENHWEFCRMINHVRIYGKRLRYIARTLT